MKNYDLADNQLEKNVVYYIEDKKKRKRGGGKRVGERDRERHREKEREIFFLGPKVLRIRVRHLVTNSHVYISAYTTIELFN